MQLTMLPVRSVHTAVLLITLGAGLMLSAAPGNAQLQLAQSSPMEITTDTPAYCLQLLDRVSDLVRLATLPVPRDVTDLTTQGQRMCAHGKTRGGIMRLRSALLLMERNNGPAYR